MRRFALVVALPDPKMVISFSRINAFSDGWGGRIRCETQRWQGVTSLFAGLVLVQFETQERAGVGDRVEFVIPDPREANKRFFRF